MSAVYAFVVALWGAVAAAPGWVEAHLGIVTAGGTLAGVVVYRVVAWRIRVERRRSETRYGKY